MHHALWAGDTYLVNAEYSEASKLLWYERIIPILEKGKVAGVFAADAGDRSDGTYGKINNILHLITGMSSGERKFIPEWLSLEVKNEQTHIIWTVSS